MERKYIFLTSLLCMTLCSCNINSKNNVSFNIKDWNAKLIDQNLLDEGDDQYKNVSYGSVESISFENKEVYDSTYSSYGLLIIKKEDNKIGFYSLIYNNWLVSPMYISNDFSYSLSSNSYVGYTLTIRNNNTYFYYDALGNELYSGENQKRLSISKQSINDKEYFYCSIVDSVTGESTKYYYNEKGMLDSNAVSEDDEYQVGDKYYDINIVEDFEGFSIDGYKFSLNLPNITVYKENGKVVSSYSLPALVEMSESYYFAGKSLVYQISQPVANDAKNYDYCVINNTSYNTAIMKYVVKTYQLNLLNGKQKEIDLDFIIADLDSIKPFKNKKGQYEYSLLTAAFLGKDKTIEDYAQILVNENGKIIANSTGFYPSEFIKLDNGNYYNKKTEILYSSSLKVIAHLDGINPVYYRGIGFVGQMYGKYGVINENGNIALPFEYDSIDRYSYNNNVFATKDDLVYKLDLARFNFSEFAKKSEFASLGDGLYTVNKENYLYYVDIQNQLLSIDKTVYNTSYIGKFNFEFGKYHFLYKTDKNTGERTYKALSSKMVENFSTFTPNEINNYEPSTPSQQAYTITNDLAHPFDFNGISYTSTNHADSSVSTLKITANYNLTLSFNYSVSSENNYDKLLIEKNEDLLISASGEQSDVCVVNMNYGEHLLISYSKDASNSSFNDNIVISNIITY